jgi:hypothetical protein
VARAAIERERRASALTGWVPARGSAATIPLAAFAGLVPGGPRTDELRQLAQATVATLQGPAGGRRVTVVVDDAAARRAGARVLLTVRSGEPVPDAIATLIEEASHQERQRRAAAPGALQPVGRRRNRLPAAGTPGREPLLFALVARRYGRGSIIVTSNRGFEACGEILGDTMVAATLIDRLIHYAFTRGERRDSNPRPPRPQSGMMGVPIVRLIGRSHGVVRVPL